MKKKLVMLSLLSLLSIPLVSAGIGDTLSNVFNKILSIGSLSFLGISGDGAVVSLTRILIGIFVFTVIFATITALGGGGKGDKPFSFFNRSQATVVAAAIAIITAIFLPAQVLLAAGTGWATVVALFLIGGPIVGLAYLVLTYPEGEDTKGTVLVKLVLCMLLFWILSAMKNAAVLG